jgi:Holliday junction DNA helicase RuvA
LHALMMRCKAACVIAQLTGTLVEKSLDSVVLDVGGVGYAVAVSLNTLAVVPQVGQRVTLLTYLQVREDLLQLFGFATPEERRAFELCISVSGIGPKLALNVLSGLDALGLAKAIAGGDVARLKRVPGIGPKTAERLVLELRDKVARIQRGPAVVGDSKVTAREAAPATSSVESDVTAALVNLGYKLADAERATEAALTAEPTAPIEAVLRRALRTLQKD